MPELKVLQRAFLAIFLLLILITFAFPTERAASSNAQGFGALRVASAAEMTPAERGFHNLTKRPYGPVLLTPQMLEKLWTVWDPAWKAKVDPNNPQQIRQLIFERYGLSEAPYPNDGVPMQFVATERGWVINCMICHGGRLPGSGKSMVGMPNTELDLGTLYQDAQKLFGINASGDDQGLTRGRTNAFVFSLKLLQRRNEDLSPRSTPVDMGNYKNHDLDAIPWWHLKKKKLLYSDGAVSGDFVRPIMQFTLIEPSGEKIRSWESEFSDVLEYLRSIEPPKYPWPIDARLAAEGKKVFEQTCAQCHGTYGPDGKYPNRVVPLEIVGTNSLRLTGLTREFRRYFNRSWLGAKSRAEEEPKGYIAPPLDGIWASAPYFHNGSVPTVYGVLTESARPKYFRRIGAPKEYDTRDLGIKVEILSGPATPDMPPEARRRIIDTTLPGLGNQGHPFGFPLSEKEKRQVIEYLKTL